MPETKEPHWYMTVGKFVGATLIVLACAAAVWGKADKTEVQLKADKKDLDSLTLTVSTLASKEEVKGVVSAVAALTDKLNEWRAVQREDAVKLDTIKVMIVEMKDNQKWQIQQEVDRLKWQPFKSETPATPPPANVNK